MAETVSEFIKRANATLVYATNPRWLKANFRIAIKFLEKLQTSIESATEIMDEEPAKEILRQFLKAKE